MEITADQLLQQSIAWIAEHDFILALAGGGSLLLLLFVAAALPLIIVQLPTDYFSDPLGGSRLLRHRHRLIAWPLLILKNLLAIPVLLSGIIFIFTPGQGILTIVAGLLLLDFPGKRQVEMRIVRKHRVFRAMNWIRRKAGRDPFNPPDEVLANDWEQAPASCENSGRSDKDFQSPGDS